jgi:hypothetical protein
MDHVGTAVDQPAGEADLVIVHAVPPVGSPVDRHDDDITALPHGLHPGDDIIGGSAGKAGQQIHAGPRDGRGPARRDPAGRCHDHHADAPAGKGPMVRTRSAGSPTPGHAGPRTSAALKAFQQAMTYEVHGFVVDGILGRKPGKHSSPRRCPAEHRAGTPRRCPRGSGRRWSCLARRTPVSRDRDPQKRGIRLERRACARAVTDVRSAKDFWSSSRARRNLQRGTLVPG